MKCPLCGKPMSRRAKRCQVCFLASKPALRWMGDMLDTLLEYFPREGQQGVLRRLTAMGVGVSLSAVQSAWKRYGSPVHSPNNYPHTHKVPLLDEIRAECLAIRQERDHETN